MNEDQVEIEKGSAQEELEFVPPKFSFLRVKAALPQAFIDCFWPSLEPWSPEEKKREEEKRESRLKADLEKIDQVPSDLRSTALDRCRELCDGEDERRKSVESRLTTVLGLVSVAAAVISASAAQILRPIKSTAGAIPLSVELFGVISVYVALQLLAAILAAVRGLSRMGYYTLLVEDLVPLPGESEEQYEKRQMRGYAESLSHNATLNSAKVEQMALAHRAIQNFAGGMLLLVLLLAVLNFCSL